MVQRKKSDDEVLRRSVTHGAIEMGNNSGDPHMQELQRKKKELLD